MTNKGGRRSVTDAENVVLKRIRRGLAWETVRSGGIRVGIGDDAAVWRPRAGYEAVLTCDWFLQGTHFLLDQHPPEAVGWKCLGRALSDLAAMGAEPSCFLLSLALPAERTGEWLEQFLRGLRRASRKFGCPAAGGDTTRRKDILINITAIGECAKGRAVLRSGARRGDALFVTGRLGEAEYGLHLAEAGKGGVNSSDKRLRKHLYPEPRFAVGAWLARRRMATAMMDLSDGLSSDLPRLCEASGVGARIEQGSLPCVQIEKRDSDRFDAGELALHGGDDYELLFSVAARNASRIPKRIAGVKVSRIGEITSGRRVVVAEAQGQTRELERGGWDAFRE